MPRLFVAVWPPEELVADIAELPRPATPGVRWTMPERIHVTLRFLGECDQAEALEALESATFPRATVTLSQPPERLGSRVFVLPAGGTDELAAAVTDATRFIGEPPPDHAFVGHLTVARFRRHAPSPDWPPLHRSFEVRQISLVETAPWGAYVTVADFPTETPTHSPGPHPLPPIPTHRAARRTGQPITTLRPHPTGGLNEPRPQ